MNYRSLLPFLVVVIIGCTKVQEPEFRSIGNFHLKSFSLQSAVISFNVTYFNPNNFGVTVKQAEAGVYVDTVYLGKFVQDSSITVQKNAQFSIPLSGPVSLQTILQLNLQHLNEREVLLRTDGSVKLGKAGIYINKTFHYSGKHRLQDFNLRQ